MAPEIGIRKEDKNEWERRAPLAPEQVRALIKAGVAVRVQSSPNRAISNDEYAEAGATVENDITSSPVVFAVKEIPLQYFRKNGVYIFFAHVHKGQLYNMPMLQKMLDLGCTLIDYEHIADEKGRRLIFFGRYAGLAGAIETLHALGKRLEWEGMENPFSRIKQPYTYPNLAAAKSEIRKAGDYIKEHGLPGELAPLVIGVAGYGNTSKGVQEILDDCLPIREIKPEELAGLSSGPDKSRKAVYKVVFHEKDTVVPKKIDTPFDLKDFYSNPGNYTPRFNEYVPHLTVMFNCIYWEKKYPRLLTTEYIKQLYSSGRPRLRVIGDISADLAGAIEFTLKQTTPAMPSYVYEPGTGRIIEGVEGNGPIVMAIDNLPCELPREASEEFGRALMPFAESIAKADYTVPFGELSLPDEIKKAVIAYQGKLTSRFEHIKETLKIKG